MLYVYMPRDVSRLALVQLIRVIGIKFSCTLLICTYLDPRPYEVLADALQSLLMALYE